MNLYLASASPRRRELLTQLGMTFSMVRADIDESAMAGEAPAALVERLAQQKAQAGFAALSAAQQADGIVLGADTIVVVDQQILGKPKDEADFSLMMQALSGRGHQVLTAIAFCHGNQLCSAVVSSDVRFKALTTEEIAWYWQSGEPQDKAGGYGIQGLGGRFISHLNGSFYAVMGLPLFETAELYQQFMQQLSAASIKEC